MKRLNLLLLWGVFVFGLAHGSEPLMTLKVSGRIGSYAGAEERTYLFSEAQLLAEPIHTITTSTSWTPIASFAGPRVTDLIKKVGVKGEIVDFHALDGYFYSIPLSELKKYHVILAYKMNGKRLKIRDYGPLFVVYPRDQYRKELNVPTTEGKFVWQVFRMVVR
ncbi:MAG: molybdopterin-dependent oxidoreductase [Ottowia sp.]|nr:molybdopterin-dependent oxidoreductase [Ottowia sp.]